MTNPNTSPSKSDKDDTEEAWAAREREWTQGDEEDIRIFNRHFEQTYPHATALAAPAPLVAAVAPTIPIIAPVDTSSDTSTEVLPPGSCEGVDLIEVTGSISSTSIPFTDSNSNASVDANAQDLSRTLSTANVPHAPAVIVPSQAAFFPPPDWSDSSGSSPTVIVPSQAAYFSPPHYLVPSRRRRNSSSSVDSYRQSSHPPPAPSWSYPAEPQSTTQVSLYHTSTEPPYTYREAIEPENNVFYDPTYGRWLRYYPPSAPSTTVSSPDDMERLANIAGVRENFAENEGEVKFIPMPDTGILIIPDCLEPAARSTVSFFCIPANHRYCFIVAWRYEGDEHETIWNVPEYLQPEGWSPDFWTGLPLRHVDPSPPYTPLMRSGQLSITLAHRGDNEDMWFIPPLSAHRRWATPGMYSWATPGMYSDSETLKLLWILAKPVEVGVISGNSSESTSPDEEQDRPQWQPLHGGPSNVIVPSQHIPSPLSLGTPMAQYGEHDDSPPQSMHHDQQGGSSSYSMGRGTIVQGQPGDYLQAYIDVSSDIVIPAPYDNSAINSSGYPTLTDYSGHFPATLGSASFGSLPESTGTDRFSDSVNYVPPITQAPTQPLPTAWTYHDHLDQNLTAHNQSSVPLTGPQNWYSDYHIQDSEGGPSSSYPPA